MLPLSGSPASCMPAAYQRAARRHRLGFEVVLDAGNIQDERQDCRRSDKCQDIGSAWCGQGREAPSVARAVLTRTMRSRAISIRSVGARLAKWISTSRTRARGHTRAPEPGSFTSRSISRHARRSHRGGTRRRPKFTRAAHRTSRWDFCWSCLLQTAPVAIELLADAPRSVRRRRRSARDSSRNNREIPRRAFPGRRVGTGNTDGTIRGARAAACRSRMRCGQLHEFVASHALIVPESGSLRITAIAARPHSPLGRQTATTSDAARFSGSSIDSSPLAPVLRRPARRDAAESFQNSFSRDVFTSRSGSAS